jgi:hypothetical protein
MLWFVIAWLLCMDVIVEEDLVAMSQLHGSSNLVSMKEVGVKLSLASNGYNCCMVDKFDSGIVVSVGGT